jgi:hypothetical protein
MIWDLKQSHILNHLISEEVVNNLGLETNSHPKPYPLGWICGDNNLQVTKQCKMKFAITSNYVDEVELDIVPLEICGIVLGIPYLYIGKLYSFLEIYGNRRNAMEPKPSCAEWILMMNDAS